MLKTKDQIDWTMMYVYQADVYADLHSAVIEFFAEHEHEGRIAQCSEVSTDVIYDVATWKAKRKELLLKDFALYLNGQNS